jgi:hypothetical protein
MTVAGADVRQTSRIAELERELELLEDAIAEQELYLLGGYAVAVLHDPIGQFVATCPTLHVTVAEATSEAALVALREAVAEMMGAFAENGLTIPEKDVEARCLDCTP